MTQEERFFANPFSNPEIIPARLFLFALDLKNALVQDNPNGTFDDLITFLTTKLGDLQNEIGDVDQALNAQIGATVTVNGVIKDFKKTMRDNEGFIAVQLGGKDTPEYKEFYPHGKIEYTKATKTNMSMLTDRIFEAADANTVAIGTTLANKLKAFRASWVAAQGNQSTKKVNVSDNRTERSDARVAVETGAYGAIHKIAIVYPFDVAKCSSYVQFHLLYPAGHHTHTIQSGIANASGFSMAFNKELTTSMKVKVTNMSNNADLRIGLMPTAAAPDSSKPIVKANKSKTFKPEKLGNLTDTFLMIGNLSNANPLNWKVEIIE